MLTFHLSFTLLITVDAKLLALEIDFPIFNRISSFYDLLHVSVSLLLIQISINTTFTT